jgi:hypothetical protein
VEQQDQEVVEQAEEMEQLEIQEQLILEEEEEVVDLVQLIHRSRRFRYYYCQSPRFSEFRSKSRHKYSNYITSPSRRLQSSYIYSIRNINNINDYVLSF